MYECAIVWVLLRRILRSFTNTHICKTCVYTLERYRRYIFLKLRYCVSFLYENASKYFISYLYLYHVYWSRKRKDQKEKLQSQTSTNYELLNTQLLLNPSYMNNSIHTHLLCDLMTWREIRWPLVTLFFFKLQWPMLTFRAKLLSSVFCEPVQLSEPVASFVVFTWI